MAESLPIRRVGTGQIAMIDPTTMVYVPSRPTIEDARAALLEIHHHGLLRPVPNGDGRRERVYPIEYCVTDDPRVFIVYLRNDHAELIEGRLLVRHFGTYRSPGPRPAGHVEDLIDPFKL